MIFFFLCTFSFTPCYFCFSFLSLRFTGLNPWLFSLCMSDFERFFSLITIGLTSYFSDGFRYSRLCLLSSRYIIVVFISAWPSSFRAASTPPLPSARPLAFKRRTSCCPKFQFLRTSYLSFSCFILLCAAYRERKVKMYF